MLFGALPIDLYGLLLAASTLAGWYALRALGSERASLRAYTLGVVFGALVGLGARAAGSVAIYAALGVGCAISALICTPKRNELAFAWCIVGACLFASAAACGTIYGAPSEGWALAYGPGSLAQADHLARGWITPDSTHSLRTAPIGLYAAAVSLIAAAAAFALRTRRYAAALGFALLALVSGVSAALRDDPLRSEGALAASGLILMLAVLCAWLERVEHTRPE